MSIIVGGLSGFMEDESPKVPELHSHPVMNYIRQTFMPAPSLTEADELMTTAQIAEAIQTHTGANVYTQELHDWLWQTGYRYDQLQGMDFVWMLRVR